MKPEKLHKIIAAGAVGTVLLLVGGTYLAAQRGLNGHADCGSSQIASGTAAIGGPFSLVNGTGATVSDVDVITGPSLVYFGFTFCPGVCPVDNARNIEAVELLAERGLDVVPVFISVDPGRDTPEVVAEYAEAYHPTMIGLTGTAEQVKAAADAYKVYFRKMDSKTGNYLVDHSTFTYLVFPDSGFADFYKREDTPEVVADRVACFIDASGHA